jgi:hypothetical protein
MVADLSVSRMICPVFGLDHSQVPEALKRSPALVVVYPPAVHESLNPAQLPDILPLNNYFLDFSPMWGAHRNDVYTFGIAAYIYLSFLNIGFFLTF